MQSNGGKGRCKKTLGRTAFDSLESLLVHGGVFTKKTFVYLLRSLIKMIVTSGVR